MSVPIVGIDLGTTNSLVAVASWPSPTDQPRVLAGPGERALLQSIVLYRADGSVLVGDAALGEKDTEPGMLVASAKRLMGRSVADASEDAVFRSYEVVEGEGGTARVRLRTGRTVTPQEVSAHVLEALRRRASRALGVEVTKAVITVPAYFDDAQRQATRDAARLAGLEVVRLVAEPTAAALAYGLGLHASPSRVAQNVVVYDLGGGTFDVSVLRITPAAAGAGSGGADAFEVLATHGDTHLGGDDFDHAVVRWIMEQAVALRSELPAPDDSARSRLKSAAELAKVELSLADSSVINLAPLLGQGLPAVTLSRQTFEGLIWGMVDRTIASCKRALRDASRQMEGEPVGAVVLVGGATRTPLVRRRVAECFGIEPYTAIDPDQAVALGAAVQGAMLSGAGGVGGGPGSLLLDVVPLSLGIETANGAFAKIVMRNTPIPASGQEMFSTQAENQTSIKLHVLQGEREMAADCRSLGVFHLRGIPPMPAGIPQLRVDFAVDANGLLTVSALERRSGKRLSVQVVPHHGLSKEEVERIERESFAHARSDMSRHRVADLLANSRLDLGWIRRQLARAGGDLAPQQRDAVQRCMDYLASLLVKAEADWSAADPDEIQMAKEALDRASVPLHESSIRRSLVEDPPSAGRSG